MSQNLSEQQRFRPPPRIIAALVLFIVAMAVTLIKPFYQSTSSDAQTEWRGEVKRYYPGEHVQRDMPDARVTLSDARELVVTDGSGSSTAYRIRGMHYSDKDFFALISDETTLCLIIPGALTGTGTQAADMLITDFVLRRAQVIGGECTASLSDTGREHDPQEKRND